ncbi:MAG: hypothetical protein AAFY71_24695 [Bacteroidota bacterium]
MKKISSWLIVIVASVVCYGGVKTASSHATEVAAYQDSVKQRFGASTFKTLMKAKEVYLYRLDAFMDYDIDHSPEMFKDIPIQAGPFKLEKHQIKEIRNWVQQDKNYRFDHILKRCMPSPETGLRFIKGKDTVDLQVSIRCKDMRVYTDARVILEDIDPGVDAWTTNIGAVLHSLKTSQLQYND